MIEAMNRLPVGGLLCALLLILGLGLAGSGCAGDLPEELPRLDTAFPPAPDGGYVWPDTGGSGSDLWSPPSDSYAGAPFGCQVDADCFGDRCCPSPWGVKVCAPSCVP